jgi:hypothetical protein
VVRTVVGAKARNRRRKSASGTRPMPISRRGTRASVGVATGRPPEQAFSSTHAHASTPVITAETRACAAQGLVVVQAPGPAWLHIVRETPKRTQAGNEGTCPRAPQKGRRWPSGAHAMACLPLCMVPIVSTHVTMECLLSRKGSVLRHNFPPLKSRACLLHMSVAQEWAGKTAPRASAPTTKTRSVALPLFSGLWRAGALSPERSWLPPHHRHGGEAMEGGPLDHPCAIRQIHQRPAPQIDQTHDLG